MWKAWFSKTKSSTEKDSANLDYIFPTVDPSVDGPDCSHDCADCTVKWPSSRMKIDTDKQIYGGLKPFATHVLVATGKTDWASKAEREQGSLMEAFKLSSVKSNKGVGLLFFSFFFF